MLCCCEYDERIVASFDHQIQSEYYGGNRPVSIECITMGYFSALPQTVIKSQKNHVHVIQCFIIFCRMIANKILSILPHTEKVWFNCLIKSIDVSIKYNMGKTLMVVKSNIDVPHHYTLCHFPPMLLNHNWLRYKCNWTWQIGSRWSQLHWKALYISINF